MDTRPGIQSALAAFPDRPLFDAGIGFFEALGYRSDRRVAVPPTREDFLAAFTVGHPINAELALLRDWQAASLLFQITTDEVRSLVQGSFHFGEGGTYDVNTFDSYLFIAVQLTEKSYNRTQLAGVVRAVNRIFPQPAFLLLRHGDTVSLGIIHRRPGLRDLSRDVLEKVTLIKDIHCAGPVRAHLDILTGFSLDALQAENPFHDFAGLHRAWEKHLEKDPLNRRFYSDIANWYFWALKPETGVIYPRDVEKTDPALDEGKEARSIFLIRLLTRLIFCWFLQEKGLVPRDLFRRHVAERLLKNTSLGAGTYYRAILQNLFFATLNQEMDARRFCRQAKAPGGRDTTTGLFRHADLLDDPDALRDLLSAVPFLNGGLFDCLDLTLTAAEKQAQGRQDVRLDDFFEEKGNILHLPNDLFFGEDRRVDLTHVYRDGKKPPRKPIEKEVAGLLTILGRYKFTVLENTPFEEEIALDPELLGQVFENLLASYNEATSTTARKATGSFYTPREIVAYMVDEAVRAYLHGAVPLPPAADGTTGVDRLKRLIGAPPADIGDDFTEAEKLALISAIDRIKILDPACGSGAFPMGALHRLVNLLLKLDPHNRRWKEQQLRKVERDRALAAHMEDEELRLATLAEADERAADIQRSFDSQFHELDFARKLYLIENCIYGVDIQPIATQIAKLRFFISLLVDQRENATAANRGVRPLPNLETKIVAADFLVPIERTRQVQAALFTDDRAAIRQLKLLREKLEGVRHEHFGARTPAKKAHCRRRDAELRQEMADLLRKTGMSAPQSDKLARWDPYDQNVHAPFFDVDWMFGLSMGRSRLDVNSAIELRGSFSSPDEVTGPLKLPANGTAIETGFDIVLGNPPYGGALPEHLRKIVERSYKYQDYQLDTYFLFLEHAFGVLSTDGVLSYIIPNTWLQNLLTRRIRQWFFAEKTIVEIIHFTTRVFTAVVDSEVIVLTNARPAVESNVRVKIWGDQGAEREFLIPQTRWRSKQGDPINIMQGPELSGLVDALERQPRLDSSTSITQGCKPFQVGKGVPPQTRAIVDEKPFVSETRRDHYFRKLLRGSLIQRYQTLWNSNYWIKFGDWLAEPRYSANYDAPEKIVIRQTGDSLIATLDTEQFVARDNLYTIVEKSGGVRIRYVLGLLNSGLLNWFYQNVLNPEVGEALAQVKRGHLAKLPIPAATTFQQAIIERLVDYLLWLNRLPEIRVAQKPRDAVMLAFWEQWVNALVYELFFPTELAAANLAFFRLMDEAGLRSLAQIPSDEAERLASLRATFECLNATDHPLRAALFSLGGLDFVRLIEGRE